MKKLLLGIFSLSLVACSTQKDSVSSVQQSAQDQAVENTSVRSYGPGGRIILGEEVADLERTELGDVVLTSDQEGARITRNNELTKVNKVSERKPQRAAKERSSSGFVIKPSKGVKSYSKAETAENAEMIASEDDATNADDNTILLVVLCFFIPFLAVYLYEDAWTNRVTINLILTLLCFVPGFIHALVVILGKK
jgi:uncharacterized membrane protein YqaE (UPF0057 family)